MKSDKVRMMFSGEARQDDCSTEMAQLGLRLVEKLQHHSTSKDTFQQRTLNDLKRLVTAMPVEII